MARFTAPATGSRYASFLFAVRNGAAFNSGELADSTRLGLAAPDDTTAQAEVPLLAGRPALEGRATAYVCEHFVCQRPVTEPADLAAQLA